MWSTLLLAALPQFQPAPVGCSQAHCDARLSDRAGLPPPGNGSTLLWRDSAAPGSNYALGCSANGSIAACAFGLSAGGPPYLVVYDGLGNRQWDSDLSISAATSAPIVDAAGGVIAADEFGVYRFAPGGALAWSSPLPTDAGYPISPVITAAGTVAFATTGGLVGAIDSSTGIGVTEELTDTIDGVSGRFLTRNTPATNGERIYVVAEFSPDRQIGSSRIGSPARLYALDVSSSSIDVAWYLDVGGRSGASPTVSGQVVFFDADQLTPTGPTEPHLFAVEDRGDHGAYIYKHPLTSASVLPGGTSGALASAAHDPRGGMWLFTGGSSVLVRLSESASATGVTSDGSPTADVLDAIDFSAWAGEGAQPSSAVTLAEGPSGPVGMMTSLDGNATSWWSIDLVNRTVLSQVPLGTGIRNWSAAQSPIVQTPTHGSVVVLSTFGQGAVGIGLASGAASE